MSLIDLGFRPRAWQAQVLRSLKRFSVVVVHRRGGKTVNAIMKLIDAGLRAETYLPRFSYVAPELKQAKKAAWDHLRTYTLNIPELRVHESELWVEFPHNHARITLLGADNPDSLRGPYLDGVVLDEVAQMRPTVWGEIIRPMLADREGWALFIGTPKGINLFSKLYFEATGKDDWYSALFDVHQTDALAEDELASMRRDMSPQEWRQEMLCDFNASSEDTLISIDLVKEAMGKHLRQDQYSFAPRVLGVDVARLGADRTVIQPRQGLASFEPKILVHKRTEEVVDAIVAKAIAFSAQAIFVDAGAGGGVIDRLLTLGYPVFEVNFGGSARAERFRNKGAEMWMDMKEWLERGGALPLNQEYLSDLTGRRYDYKDAAGKLSLEKKENMLMRGLRSPDLADALALTFAHPVAISNTQDAIQARRAGFSENVFDIDSGSGKSKTEYDPLERA